jgi:hypothetical protein
MFPSLRLAISSATRLVVSFEGRKATTACGVLPSRKEINDFIVGLCCAHPRIQYSVILILEMGYSTRYCGVGLLNRLRMCTRTVSGPNNKRIASTSKNAGIGRRHQHVRFDGARRAIRALHDETRLLLDRRGQRSGITSVWISKLSCLSEPHAQ